MPAGIFTFWASGRILDDRAVVRPYFLVDIRPISAKTPLEDLWLYLRIPG